MKTTTWTRSILGLLALVALASPRTARSEVSAEVSLGFEAGLAPYGEWIVVPHHGRVWRPRRVAGGWRPYYYGRWVWTADGWFWDSGEPWGWAVYHYGRWYVDPVYGWLWVPGTAWAPAWVSWRFGGGAIGWAPLLPGFSVWWTAGYPVHQSSWVFVPTQRFVGVRVESVAFSPARSAAFFSSTRPAPPRSVSGSAPRLGGPPRHFVERQIGRPIRPARIAAVSTPHAARATHREGVVSVYRPAHAGMGRSTAHRAPARAPERHAAIHRAPERRAAIHRAPERQAVRQRAPQRHAAVERAPERHATARSAPPTAHGRAAPSRDVKAGRRPSATRPAHAESGRR